MYRLITSFLLSVVGMTKSSICTLANCSSAWREVNPEANGLSQRLEPVFERHVKTARLETHEDVSLHSRFDLMVNRPDPQIVLEVAEDRFDFHQEHIKFP